jgi:hypothetical protein
MNLADTALNEGFYSLLTVNARTMQTVKAPLTQFQAILNVANPFDPETELGSDPREKCTMEVLQPGPVLNVNDFITEFGTVNKWQVVYRDNNPADFTVKYVLAVVIAALDT